MPKHAIAAGCAALACAIASTSLGAIAAQGGRGAGPMDPARAAASNVFLAETERMPVPRIKALADLTGIVVSAASEIDVQVVVGVGGAVEHAHVVKPAANRFVLEAAVLDASQRWTYAPATLPNGRAIATLTIVRWAIAPPATPGQPPVVSPTVLPAPEIVPPSLDPAKLPASSYRAGAAGVRPPGLIVSVSPHYTRDAMARKVVGRVSLDVLIEADGTVGAAHLVRPLDPDLDRQALIAAGYWLFRPASLGGRDVPMVVSLELDFRVR